MAAARERSSSSSSSEAEAALQRFREASWNPHGHSKKSNVPSAESRVREKGKVRGQDGHELQTTPEFRAHVAKKLGAILDSSIAIMEHKAGPEQDSRNVPEAEDDGDANFRLFSSSVPGDCGQPESVPQRRRRLQCSSSSDQDSDQEWQRCREAAVSAADILKLSSLPAAPQNSSTDHVAQAPEPSQRKKKRRRKTALAQAGGDDSGEEAATEAVQNGNGTDGPWRLGGNVEEVDSDAFPAKGVMVKRKKKRKKKEVEARTN